MSSIQGNLAPHVVDLFCGIGGLSRGLKDGGLEVVAGYDIDKTCRYAYEAINEGAEFVEAKIEDVTAEMISSHYPEGVPRVLVGCAPCQPFSSLTQKKAKGKKNNGREKEWATLRKFADLAVEISAEIISMENVTRLAKFEEHGVFAEFVERLERSGYTVVWYKVYAPDYGVPQTRRRLVLFASKYGAVKLIEPTHEKGHTDATVRKALEGLRPLDNGESDPDDPLHTSRRLIERNLERIRASEPGGSWKDWDEELRLRCHKEGGETYGSVYGRMEWDTPGPTMTTQFFNYGSGRFGHPEQNRPISLREGALLQTFPENCPILPPGSRINFSRLGKHIGNAVPVRLGEVIADSIKKHLSTVRVTPNHWESERHK